MERRTLVTLGAVLPAVIASFLAAFQSPMQAAVGHAPVESTYVAQAAAPSSAISIDGDPYKQGIFYRSEVGVVRSSKASIRWQLIGRKLRRYDIRTYYLARIPQMDW